MSAEDRSGQTAACVAELIVVAPLRQQAVPTGVAQNSIASSLQASTAEQRKKPQRTPPLKTGTINEPRSHPLSKGRPAASTLPLATKAGQKSHSSKSCQDKMVPPLATTAGRKNLHTLASTHPDEIRRHRFIEEDGVGAASDLLRPREHEQQQLQPYYAGGLAATPGSTSTTGHPPKTRQEAETHKETTGN
jgi:hypothetical protein